MERSFHWFLVLTVCASFIIIDGLSHSSLAAAENYERADRMLFSNTNDSGFISIDCGSSEYYSDKETGFWYQTDEKFVETGESRTVPGPAQNDLNYHPTFGKRLKTLRCFSKGERNCYTLRPEQGNNSRYLIRAFFSYGNYDGKNETQSFDLHLGVNLWDTINLEYGDTFQFAEIVHSPSSETIQVCLVKTGPTIPFISALELRPLNSSLYNATSSNTPQPLLSRQSRTDVGSSETLRFSRYEDDVYDRVWRHDEDVDSWPRLTSDNSTYIDHGTGTTLDAYRLPAQVWRTAGVSPNVSSPLQFDYNSVFEDVDRNEYYVYFHFTEIMQLPAGQKRIIDRIALNSDENILSQSQPLVLEYLKPVTISGHTVGDNINFSISAAADSDAPPILNAFEIYKLIKQLDSPTDPRDVAAIVDIKSAYQITRLSWQGDPCRPMHYTWVGLKCSSDTNPRITSMNLRSSNLKGVINNSFSYLTELNFLDLSDNELEGPLPEFLAELPKLEVLNLTGNKFSGPIPKALKEKAKSTLKLSVDNNPELCMKDSCNKKNLVVPLVASLSVLIVIFVISLGFWILLRRRKVEAHTSSLNGGSLRSAHRAFRYTDILNITDNFKTVIGEGGFGKVYPGILQHQVQVAVKLLSPSSIQGYREFRSEAQLLSLVHHRNLVSLIGYCDEGDVKALVYEYMPNGNLLQHLSDKNPSVLKWNERLNIAIDTANGLDYLHNGCNPPIVHRDLKTSNILLDQSMHAKIADFGLSRAFGSNIDSHISTRPAGTPGYIDPEFHRTGNSNKKSDVYSFGIILLELITGQLAIARATGKNIHILNWVKPKVDRGDIQSIVDPRLQGEFDTNSAWKVVEIALSCTSPIATERPDISQIFVELKECLSLEKVGVTTEITLTLDTESAPLAR